MRTFAPTLALLVVAVVINYIDRGNLALAAPLIRTEWGNVLLLVLGILFFSVFLDVQCAALQFAVGWLVDRFSATVLLAIGFLVWSLSTAATGFATGFATLLTMRLLLGAGESVMFPASSKICALHLPEEARGFANGMIIAAIPAVVPGSLNTFWRRPPLDREIRMESDVYCHRTAWPAVDSGMGALEAGSATKPGTR